MQSANKVQKSLGMVKKTKQKKKNPQKPKTLCSYVIKTFFLGGRRGGIKRNWFFWNMSGIGSMTGWGEEVSCSNFLYKVNVISPLISGFVVSGKR